MEGLDLKMVDSLIENTKHKLIIKLISEYKLSPSEIVHLRTEDVDLEKSEIILSGANKRKTINLSDDIKKSLQEVYPTSKDQKYLFSGRSPDQPMSKKNIHKICENVQEKLQKSNASKSEVKITPQILRTSEVSSDAKNTVSQLSDSSLNVTKKPLSPIPDSDNIRSELKKQIYDLAAKNRHILLVGPIGIGKSHILRNLRLGTKTLFIDDLYDLKSTLVNWMMIIHNNDKKAAQEDLEDSADTPSVKYLQRTSITHLLRTILENIKNERYTIIIDSIDSVTPRAIKFLDIIKSRCNIIAAARQLPKSKDSLLWNFDVVEVGPLSKEESYSLMEKQIAAIGSIMNLEKDIKEKVYSSAGGNPRIMIELLNRLSQDQSPAAIANDLNNLTQIGFKQEKSIMPFLLVVVILLLPLRYISNITENSTQRTIGTIALVFFLVFRYLMRYLKG